MAQLSPSVLLKKAERAYRDKRLWRDLLADVYEYFLPQRNLYYDDGDGTSSPQQGQKKVDRVFDSTASTSMINFANMIQSKLMPAYQKWVVLKAGPLVPESMREAVNRQLEEITDQLFAVFQASNFDTAINEVLLDLGVGTGCMLILQGDETEPAKFVPVPLAQIALIAGPWGTVDGIVRTHKVAAHNIMAQWPDAKLPSEVEEKVNDPDKNDEELVFCEITYADRDDSGALSWRYEVIHKDSKKRIVERVHAVNPWVTPRWIKVAGEVYGRGPAVQALPDVKTQNKVVELTLKNAALHIAGVYTGVNDGVLNPNNVTIRPGIVIPVASNGGNRGPSLLPLQRAGSFDLAKLEWEKLSMQIKEIMFDRRLPAETGAVRSATEIIERVRELANDIGSPFGRLMRELVVPTVQRVLDIMVRMNLIPEVKVNGLTVSAVVVSPLAQEQNLAEVEAVVRWAEILKFMGGDQLLQLGAVVEDVPDWIGEKLGVPARLRRDEENRNQMMIMAGQAAAQGIPVGGQAANQVPVGGAQPPQPIAA